MSDSPRAPAIADALTGRAEYLRLAPFSQGELRGSPEDFLDTMFMGRWPEISGAEIGRGAYAEILAAGGYPAAVARNESRRTPFFASYVDTLMQRDLSSIARVHDQANVRRLLFGLGAVAGPAFETFVAMEVARQAAWQVNPPQLFHFRDRDGREVDLVLERRDGSVVAIEVKTAASVSSRDLRGLRHLRDKLGSRFKAGVVLYTGEQTVPFEDRLAAVPLSGLWGQASQA